MITALENRFRCSRIVIPVLEYGEVDLPPDIMRSDGTFDLYDDVQTRFEIAYKRRSGKLVIRGGGWIGLVPLNEKYALQINTRVPVANLEKIIQRGANAKTEVLERYSRFYGDTAERPQSIFDVMTDQFLRSIELIKREGLAKTYVRRQFQSSTPSGRIDPFRTAVTTRRMGQPVADFSAFVRTTDFPPNRIIRATIERLLVAYRDPGSAIGQTKRARGLLDAVNYFQDVGHSEAEELGPTSIRRQVEKMPDHRLAYVDALRLSLLIVQGLGVALREPVGATNLPSVLVDMAHVFESYARETLRQFARSCSCYEVLDGNLSGEGGASTHLYSEYYSDGDNPLATPDIVIKNGEETVAILDVKYKPAQEKPDRSELNQIMTYGARYQCDKVMIVYPQASRKGPPMSLVGRIESTGIYRANLDLNASDLNVAEKQFAQHVFGQL